MSESKCACVRWWLRVAESLWLCEQAAEGACGCVRSD